MWIEEKDDENGSKELLDNSTKGFRHHTFKNGGLVCYLNRVFNTFNTHRCIFAGCFCKGKTEHPVVLEVELVTLDIGSF